MKGNFVHTIIKSIFILAILIALIGMTNAEARRNNPTGSWKCTVGKGDEVVVFLVTFNLDGTLTASDSDTATSDYHGTWKRTGPNTFESTDYSFDIPSQCIMETYTINTMMDEDTIKAEAIIKECSGNNIVPPELTCTRILIAPLSMEQ